MTVRLRPIVSGNPSGPTLVFIQGWPDDASLWDAAVAALAPTYRCVRVTLPNFDGHREARWGYSTNEIIDALSEFVRVAARGDRVTLILHDWGSYWGHVVHHRHPELVERVVGIDVAPHFKPTLGGAFGIVLYQSWLASAFAVGGALGDSMTRRLAMAIRVPNARHRTLDSTMNYPYRNVWGDIFRGRLRDFEKNYWPTCPILFLYGEKKPFHFHSPRWVDHVKKVGGEVIGIPSDHWVPLAPSFVPTLERWLAKTNPS